MLYRKLSFLAVAFVAAIMLAGCNSCGNKQEEAEGTGPTEFEKRMTDKDTTAVRELVDRFFTYAINKEFGEAAAMLYRNDNFDGRADELNNEEMASVKRMLETFPMVDYEIEYIKFDRYRSNEVLCKVIMSRGTEGKPDVTTKMFFKPVKNSGSWYLCLTNSQYGDKGVVSPEKRDSVKSDYKSKERQKKQQERDKQKGQASSAE